MNNSQEKSILAIIIDNIKKVTQRVWSTLKPVFKHIKIVVQYYLKTYPLMVVYVQDHIPGMQMAKNISREIRLSEAIESSRVIYDDEGCHICFPDCCIVSGEKTDNPWISEVKEVENFALPVIIPSVITILSLFFSMFFWNLLILPAGILAGMIIGYMNREFRTVFLKYRKSDSYRLRNFPQLRIFGPELIVKVGQQDVRLKFFQKEFESVYEDHHSKDSSNEMDRPILDDNYSSQKNQPPSSIKLHDTDDSTPLIPEGGSNDQSEGLFDE